jgi:hypothetical protein
MVTVPLAIPVTTPVDDTVATEASVLLQVPPDTVVLITVLPPMHSVVEPDNVPADGCGFTVTAVDDKQPVGKM